MDSISNFVSDIGHRISDIVHGEDHEQHFQHEQDTKEDHSHNPLLDDEEVEDAAIEASRQEYSSIKPSAQFKCGPVLRYQDVDVNQRHWVGSVLVVTEQRDHLPRLVLRDPTKSQLGYVSARHLDSWQGNHFYRYDIRLSLLNHREKNIEYWFETENGRQVHNPQKWNFFVPALDEGFNWAFYSCNGFTSDVEGELLEVGPNPLWDDLLSAHDQKPFHAMIGGGDQIYNDDVLATPEMVEWLSKDEKERQQTEFTSEKKYAVEKFYFEHYTSHFSSNVYSQALSLIPSVNCWDDHDILDGYGSYPVDYQLCPVMQGIGAAAAKFYLLFQQHANPNTTVRAGLTTSSSGKGWSCVTHFGKRTLVLLPDTRSERSKETILSNETYEMLNRQVREQLLPTTRHLVVVLGTPLVYPALTLFEDALETMGDSLSREGVLGKIFGKCKAFQNVLGQFGPELLDDLVDSWACNIHTEEKKKFVELLQAIAVSRNVRVTFVGGDVHVGGAGRLFGTNNADVLRDPYHMTQIVSSAIVNGPPPGSVISALHQSAKTYPLNDYTSEQMTDIFNMDVTGDILEHKKLLNRRNWCEVRELVSGQELEFTIRVENHDHVGTKKYPIRVERLESAKREQ
ncbi:hypothetical protein BGZ49_008588 [Haplosporangium sp. Z 27]|nr:hypothetical protein BGZ49_008588 [Haplosporangium sp. Z 27]